jgi:hypothetical protein
MKRVLLGLVVAVLTVLPSKASADPIDLFQWVFNVDGTIYDSFGIDGSSVLPGNFSLTPSATGVQGLLTVAISGVGAHSFIGFYDYELDEQANGFTNEYGGANGVAPAGLSWEVDEPGFVFGDIYTNVLNGALGNTSAFAGPEGADDASVALGWNFLLGAGETALINILISTTAPLSGFYISHFDTLTSTALYYSTSLAISGPPSQVPESGAIVSLGLGLAMLIAARRWGFGRIASRRLG